MTNVERLAGQAEVLGATPGEARRGYHHGDLRRALVEAGLVLAREGGPQAVVLREAARQTGVSATAAYRHFTDHADLVHAVKVQAVDMLAAAMTAALAAIPPTADPDRAAVARLRAILAGYVDFAVAEPGLFRLAFDQPEHERPAYTGRWPHEAFRLLSETVDALVACGRIEPARRPYTEIVLWSAAHGFAMVLITGPLTVMPPAERDAALDRLTDLVLRGL